MEKSELFVTVHCGDEMDREKLIPLRRIKYVETNEDGSDSIITVDDEVFFPRYEDNFYTSIIEVFPEHTA